jgi:putative FmdB family regulatory protein
MPTYTYKCEKCDEEQDVFHSIVTEPDIFCKKCNSKCKRIFVGSTNFILKGTDWPSKGFSLKQSMAEKNAKMSDKMTARTSAGEGVRKISDLAKVS